LHRRRSGVVFQKATPRTDGYGTDWGLFSIQRGNAYLGAGEKTNEVIDLIMGSFKSGLIITVFVFAGLAGLIPESGHHMIFVMLFSTGLIPFSVLLTSSIVQDGHGRLPRLSYSIRNSIEMKLINLVIGLGPGFSLFLLNP
jgi:hypothetical protein